jgi:hypothetical protein
MSTSLNGLQSLVYLMQLLKGNGAVAASQNPQTSVITDTLKTVGGKNGATKDEIESQLSIFDNQLSTFQIFAAIPQFAQYISPMLSNIQKQHDALELVLDNFEAFSGGDSVIDKYDRLNIEEAAGEDDNEADFSDEDLEALYDMNGIDAPEEDFSLSNYSFSSSNTIKNKSGNQTRVFDADSVDDGDDVLVKDSKGNDTYSVSNDVEDANIFFTTMNEGDKLNLEGTWTSEQIEDANTEEDYVKYTNEETGTNVYVKVTDDNEDILDDLVYN